MSTCRGRQGIVQGPQPACRRAAKTVANVADRESRHYGVQADCGAYRNQTVDFPTVPVPNIFLRDFTSGPLGMDITSSSGQPEPGGLGRANSDPVGSGTDVRGGSGRDVRGGTSGATLLQFLWPCGPHVRYSRWQDTRELCRNKTKRVQKQTKMVARWHPTSDRRC